MKNLKTTILVFLVCISLIIPRFRVEAEVPDTNTEVGTEIDENTGNESKPDGEKADSEEGTEKKELGDEPDSGDKPKEEKSGEKPEPGNNPNDEKTDKKSNSGNEPEEEHEDEGAGVEGTDGDPDFDIDEYVGVGMPVPMLLGAGPDDDPPLLEGPTGVHGSGSYQLNKVDDDSRFYTEYYVAAASGKSFTTADIIRRTTIKVYAKYGETIYFGSSVANSEISEDNIWQGDGNVTGADIVITPPSGPKVAKDVLLPSESMPYGKGYIANRNQEYYGPALNETDRQDTKYYEPLYYNVPETGIYTFEFHSVTGYNDGKSPTPVAAQKDSWEQGKTTVAAWDITVVGSTEVDDGASGKKTVSEVKEGRAWADYLALTTGGGDAKSDLNVHVLSHDGYVYKVDFEKAAPFGFIFFANNTGFMTSVTDDKGNTTRHPIYHSFYDSTNDLDGMTSYENISVHKPYEEDSETEETYKIFFNEPSKDLNEIEIKTEPISNVVLTDFKFTGISENIALARQGGYFTFHSNSEAMITIQLDLRKAILDSEGTMDSYEGSGIVEITAPAHDGDNSFYWDGKDTEGNYLPAGIYGNNNVVIATEIKRGELHFPVIDMEGLYGGLHIERLNGDKTKNPHYIYYNNNPLVYGNIDGKDAKRASGGQYDILSDGTKSYKISGDKGGAGFFNKDKQQSISTLVKDTKDYLAKKYFNTSYELLEPAHKAIIDAEFGKGQDTYHFEPVDSSETTMLFSNKSFNGGGNQAGIDVWTYYSQGIKDEVISFAIMDSEDKGVVRGQIFYDGNKNSKYDVLSETDFDPAKPDYLLPHVKVRLIDSNGDPLVHKELLPCFDDAGYFIYNDDGTVKHEEKTIEYEAVTDSLGYYRFTGVPFTEVGQTYYVQVMLTDVQSEVLRYTCTTSQKVKEMLVTEDNKHFIDKDIAATCGADGNKLVDASSDHSKIYKYKYGRDTVTNETIFDKDYAQSVVCSTKSANLENGIHVEEFKKIGYCTTVPSEHQKDYRVKKEWIDGTHEIDDGLIVELWVWNDSAVKEENPLELSRRTGALMDTQVLSKENGWQYTWKGLDDRLQYYVLEYYTKKKPDGEIIYNDKHEPRKVLIGGTMPIFSTIPAGNNGTYGFAVSLGDYPESEKIQDPAYPDDPTKKRIKIQKFPSTGTETHANSITKKEKLESVDNNARQYDVTYDLSIEGGVNVIKLKNSQVYDDRTYFVWLDHETSLPEFIGKTFVEDGVRKSHALTLVPDSKIDGTEEYSIKGISVSSVDAAQSVNTEGNATKAFRLTTGGTSALFTATNHGNYKTGTGTRTYQVKYVVDKTTKQPVSIVVKDGKLVLKSDNNVEVESDSNYLVYTWFMTIHVYDVIPDGVIEYDPSAGSIKLQDALSPGTELTWKLNHAVGNENAVTYTSENDTRGAGILKNDIYRVPLYKAAVDPNMGSCADLVGIAYAGSAPVNDVSKLDFEDTYNSKYGKLVTDDSREDGTAIVQGSGGFVKAVLNTPRNTRINRTQDHANYAEVTFTPNKLGAGEDVFYYKIAVFAEDNTYKNYLYDDIDASEGVVMYTYFTMKPKRIINGGNTNEGSNGGSSVMPTDIKVIILNPNGGVESIIYPNGKSPKTGDNNNLILWASLALVGVGLMVFGLYNNKTATNNNMRIRKKRRRVRKK